MNKKLIVFACALITYGVSGIAAAQSLQSPNYHIDESYIGPGGSIQSQSATYQTNSTLGDIGVGSSDSTNYTLESGFNTTSDPRLSVVVNTSSIAFGYLSTSVASTATATFSILNYTAHGYSVFTIGSPPTNSGHQLTGISPTAPSQTGVEQFGMNLKANTSPTTLGADPVQVPSGSFSYGAASTGYSTANNYRYVAGEEIAHADKSSGRTDYTISYIANVATTTPGGQYLGTISLVAVGTY